MARETADDKARRLLQERRLEVIRVDPEKRIVHARVRGDEGLYDLGYDPHDDQWRCTCEASVKFRRRCSHLRALQLIVPKPPPRRPIR